MIDANSLIINTKSELIEPNIDSLPILFHQLEMELNNSKIKGVGLAAVQIGLLKRAAIIRTETTALNLWNPKIIKTDGEWVSSEGCLSFPGITRSVRRAKEVTLQNGDGRKYVLYGLDAIVVAHELDHLDGVTIADKNYASLKVGRNKLCPCKSGKKFKKCHLGNENALQQILIGSQNT